MTIDEDYDDNYYRAFKDAEANVRTRLVDGRRHVYESEMKKPGEPTATPITSPGPT